MAKKRILKKEINYIFGDLLFDVLICQQLTPNADEAKVEAVISRINQNCNEFISRAHYTPNGKNKKAIKQYYKKLIQDLDNEVEQISQEIEAQNKCSDKQ